MREIKFRYVVQHEETGYITSEIFTYDEIEVGCVNNWLASIPRYFVVSKDQYSGLHDKNGKEIYKSNICRIFGFGKAFRQEVVYQNGAFGYCVEHQGFISFAENHNFHWENGKSEHIEVIGNIYENPELLEGGTPND